MANCKCGSNSFDLCEHCEETFANGFDSGRDGERERIVKKLRDRICFGHLETGNCEHSVCFGNASMIEWIEAGE